MNKKYAFALALVALVVTSVACEKKETPPPADTGEKPSTAATPPAPPPVAAAAPAAIDLDSLPVEEEFEAEAEKEVTSANLNAKLDELEKEISAP
jgi:hypothetical protein